MARDSLVYCRVCGAQIAKSAKKCPQCGAKQRKGHVVRNLLLLILILGIGFFVYTKITERVPTIPGGITLPTIENRTDADSVSVSERPAPSMNTAIENSSPLSENASSDGGSTEFREFMDSYEAFINEYCDFMENLDHSDTVSVIKSVSLVAKYAELSAKADSYNEDNLSTEDYKYYIDVMARCDKRLLDAADAIDN